MEETIMDFAVTMAAVAIFIVGVIHIRKDFSERRDKRQRRYSGLR